MKKLQKITLAFLLTVSSSHFMNSMKGPEPTIVDVPEREQQRDAREGRDVAPIGSTISDARNVEGKNPMNEKNSSSDATDGQKEAPKEGSLTVSAGDEGSEKKSLKDKLSERSKSLWKKLVADPFKSMKTKIKDMVSRLLEWTGIKPVNGYDVLQRAKNMVGVTRASEILRSVGEKANWTKEQFAEAKADFGRRLETLVRKGKINKERAATFMKNFVADKVGKAHAKISSYNPFRTTDAEQPVRADRAEKADKPTSSEQSRTKKALKSLEQYKRNTSKFLARGARTARERASKAVKSARQTATNLFSRSSGPEEVE